MKISLGAILLMATLTMPCCVHADNDTGALKEIANTLGFQPKDGIVPDAQTAIAVAIAVWNPIYGAKEIASQKPYQAVLNNGQWTITGSLPKGWVGGVATAVISRKDGRVIKIYHTK